MNPGRSDDFQELCVDFHTHILPKMDDGSSSSGESVRMLRASVSGGVTCIVLTPHFLAERESPERFLVRRKQCMERLQTVWTEKSPRLIPGAETAYFDGISSMDALPGMCLGNSRCLLLEMPFCPWTERMISEVRYLSERGGYRIVLAHAERYLRFQKSDVFERLTDCGVRMQMNAGFVIDLRTRRKALRLLKEGRVHLLGSDSHNMEYRPPNLGKACRILREKGYADELREIMNRAGRLLDLSAQERAE